MTIEYRSHDRTRRAAPLEHVAHACSCAGWRPAARIWPPTAIPRPSRCCCIRDILQILIPKLFRNGRVASSALMQQVLLRGWLPAGIRWHARQQAISAGVNGSHAFVPRRVVPLLDAPTKPARQTTGNSSQTETQKALNHPAPKAPR